MADPVGEDGWLALVDEASRTASNLEQRVGVIELYKRATAAEPFLLKLWLAYCEWVWSLYTDCQTADAGWPTDEQQYGQEIFTLDLALGVWQEGVLATSFRLNDSHELWNRYISIELEQLAKAPNRDNVARVRNLFLDRLQIPHSTWNETSQMFSSFITKYDEPAWEATMVEATRLAEEAKTLWNSRESHELRVQRALDSGDTEALKFELRDYLNWEDKQSQIEEKAQSKPKKGRGKKKEEIPGADARRRNALLSLRVALFERVLSTSALRLDADIWQDYIAFASQKRQDPVPRLLSIIQRAATHCPWSGALWSRYILTAEAEGVAYADIEAIKHAATNSPLDRDGMASVVEVYVAWGGYLCRRATVPGASDEDVDVAEMGLHSALESVQEWGRKLYGKEFRGDTQFRIDRIMIQYQTARGAINDARTNWENLSKIHCHSYEFWQNYYFWEMTVRIPSATTDFATGVLVKAVHERSLDWPEKMWEIYLRHCNVYTNAQTLLTAMDTVRFQTPFVVKRREKEAAEAAAMYAQQQPIEPEVADTESLVGGSKRKREESTEKPEGSANKKVKGLEQGSQDKSTTDQQTRDRENTSVIVANLPAKVTQTSVKKFFKGYGHISSITVKPEADENSSTAFIEFSSIEDVESALLRNDKYLDDKQVSVEKGTGLTLYITNFPPTADEAYLRNLFKVYGEVFDVRLPSLRVNTRRRFAYLTFRTPEAAAAAIEFNGKSVGDHKLTVLYSNPSMKKARDGAIAEGRELHVTSLDTKLNEQQIREVFGKYGKVVRVNLLKSRMTGENTGAAFISFEKKEEAEAALALDKTVFKSRIITVEVSAERNFKPSVTTKGTSASPAPDAEGDSVMTHSPAPSHDEVSKDEHYNRTISLLNIPDTVNDARVRALAEPYGPIEKLTLRLDHQGALIEYRDAASAGRAALGLENYEIAPGRKLRTGGKKDLFAEKSEIKTDKVQYGQAGKKAAAAAFMQPSAPVKRPGPGGRGGLGVKRGLGLSAVSKASSGSGPITGETNGNGDNSGTGKQGNQALKPKSNADFKKMFVKEGESK